ncbi:thiosulfate reductase PhsA [Shewanella youngdeokensis]|uniref:Thiosulfate reductase PhsA n=1 Tax=Shewanella youngdeokensis TaxID=2999068 RepID=A0ABZ0JVT7_9GAMM|nr:thiosulfate reductase PhsA [Shewanella sp. DAU334]
MISRREFLAQSSALCAIAAYAPGTLGAQTSLTPHQYKPFKTIHSICEMCSTRCPITVEKNATHLFIKGNKQAKSFGGKVCARGVSGGKLLNDPHRLVKPIKRMGPRGAGQWQEIEWSEAYSIISDKLLKISNQHGPESIAISSKSGSLANHIFHFAKSIGTPNTFTHASTCPASYKVAAKVMFGSKLKRDLKNCKYVVNFGHNLYEGINMSLTRAMSQAQANGSIKVVVFEPRLSIVADKADEWHMIKPGTDITLALALSHVLIAEKLYDHEFVESYVEGFDAFAASVTAYTPEWAEAICDVPAQDIRRIAQELAAAAPAAMVDFGHRTTFANEEFDLRRAIYAVNILLGNIERKGGLFFAKKSKLYNKLAGAEVAPSLTKIKVDNLPKPQRKRIDLTDPQFKFAAKGGGIYSAIPKAVLTKQPYPIKAWIMSRSNPMQTVSNRNQIQQCMEAIDFVVACDVYISESAAYADVVLPESTYLERDEDVFDKSSKNPAYYLRQRVYETIGDTKPSWLIFKELAEQMGIGQYFPWYDIRDYQQQQVVTNPSLLSRLQHQGYQSFGVPLLLREPKMVQNFRRHYPKAVPACEKGDYSHLLTFKTPSGKIELTAPSLEEIAPGRSVIKYHAETLKQENELFFIQGKTTLHTNSATQSVPLLRELQSSNPVWIHPVTAAERSIHDGQAVILSNAQGEEHGTALVTPGIRKDTVFAHMGFGSKHPEQYPATAKGVHCGNLLPDSVAPISGNDVHTTGISIRPA